MSEPLLGAERELLAGPLASAGIDPRTTYLVGGAVRDALLGRPVLDLDLIVSGDPAEGARGLARALGGVLFALSERHGAWRIVLSSTEPPVIDVSPITGGSVEADLRRRDFTVNALAVGVGDGHLIDVVDGVAAVGAGRLSAVSGSSFTADPLRLVRLARFASELGFAVDDETLALATAAASLVDSSAGERVSIELARVLAADAGSGLRVLDATGVGTCLVPGRGRPLVAAARAVAALGPGAGLPRQLEPELGRRLDETTDVRATLRLGALLLHGGAAAPVAARLRLSRAARTLLLRSVDAVSGGAPPSDPEALLRWLRAAGPAGLAALALAIAHDPSLRRPRVPCRTAPGSRTAAGQRTGSSSRSRAGTGPGMGAILRAIGDEQALGRLATREDALEAGRRLASKADAEPGT